jgi:GNAT superfamily N-acetyltransferase
MGAFALRFDTVETSREVHQLQEFLLQHPADYDPASYTPWVVDTCIPGIKNGIRRSFAWWQEGNMVADAIIKLEGRNVAQLRHFRVEAPGFTNRGLGTFALRQVFPVAVDLLDDQGLIDSDVNSITVQLDTRGGSAAEAFFAHNGFKIIGQSALYTPNKLDVIMERSYPLG